MFLIIPATWTHTCSLSEILVSLWWNPEKNSFIVFFLCFQRDLPTETIVSYKENPQPFCPFSLKRKWRFVGSRFVAAPKLETQWPPYTKTLHEIMRNQASLLSIGFLKAKWLRLTSESRIILSLVLIDEDIVYFCKRAMRKPCAQTFQPQFWIVKPNYEHVKGILPNLLSEIRHLLYVS